MNTQIIVAPNGERLVVIPETEFEALIEAAEDAADRAAIRRFEAALAAGEEEWVPVEFVDRILGGESPVRVWREFRGLSSEQLAERADISPSRLADLESRANLEEDEAIRALAKVLRVDPDDLAFRLGE